MTSAQDEFDRVTDAVLKIGALAHLRDLVHIAIQASYRKCGRCEHWMKSKTCPQEKNVNGFSQGPSRNGSPCPKFEWNPRAVKFTRQRQGEAIAFAKKYDLPIPQTLEAQEEA